MHRRTAVSRRALAVLAGGLVPASSALGASWRAFPEQPGDHVSTACAAVLSTDQGALHSSSAANAIVDGLYVDACLGG